jgi:hypothetical protein
MNPNPTSKLMGLLVALLLPQYTALAQTELRVLASNEGNGRFIDFSRGGIYQRFQFKLWDASRANVLDQKSLSEVGECRLIFSSPVGPLEWESTADQDDGYLLTPAKVNVPASTERSFKPRTSADFKKLTLDEMTERISDGNLSELKVLLADAKAIVAAVPRSAPGTPGPTEMAYLHLLKDMCNEAATSSALEQQPGYGEWLSGELVKLVEMAGKYPDNATCFKMVADGCSLWFQAQQQHVLKGMPVNWYSKTPADVTAFKDEESRARFAWQARGILKCLQKSYNSTQRDSLGNRISRNLKAPHLPASDRADLLILDDILKLNLTGSADAVLADLQMHRIERAADILLKIAS